MASPKDKIPPTNNSEGLDAEIRATEKVLESVMREMRDNSVALATFVAEVKNLRERVDSLSRTLNDGSGKGSMIVRVSLLENDMGDIKKELERNERKIERLDDTSKHFIIEERKDQREQVNRKWQFYAAIIGALLAWATALITIFWKKQ